MAGTDTPRVYVRDLWNSDEAFNRLYAEVQAYTVVDKVRCFVLYQMLGQAKEVAGEAAEVGVFRGGTARLIAKVLDPKPVHLFDTFAGMPATDPGRDLPLEGRFAETSLELVQRYLQDCGNVALYQGRFPAGTEPLEDHTFAFVHVDVDIYQSVLDCCAWFYGRMSAGGVLLFDDYGWSSCPGAKDAVDEFFADKAEQPVFLPTGQAFVTTIPASSE